YTDKPTQLDYLCLTRLQPFQFLQCSVEVDQLCWPLFCDDGYILKPDPDQVAAVTFSFTISRIVDQNATHSPRYRAKEMATIFPPERFTMKDAQVRFVNQCRSL